MKSANKNDQIYQSRKAEQYRCLAKSSSRAKSFSRLNQIVLSSFFFLFVLTVLDVADAEASGTQTHASIRESVKSFLQQQLENNHYQDISIHVNRLDSRLKLVSCEKTLEAFLSSS